jgi:peptide/nickel transport system substrate-binding protein
MKALISLLLIQLSQKYNLIYGLAIIFQWFTQLDEKLNIQPDIAKSWTISPDAKPLRYGKDIYFQKHILFGNDSTRTVNASDFEYSSTDY